MGSTSLSVSNLNRLPVASLKSNVPVGAASSSTKSVNVIDASSKVSGALLGKSSEGVTSVIVTVYSAAVGDVQIRVIELGKLLIPPPSHSDAVVPERGGTAVPSGRVVGIAITLTGYEVLPLFSRTVMPSVTLIAIASSL